MERRGGRPRPRAALWLGLLAVGGCGGPALHASPPASAPAVLRLLPRTGDDGRPESPWRLRPLGDADTGTWERREAHAPGGQPMVELAAHGQATLLWCSLDEPRQVQRLRWRWRAVAPLERARLDRRERDDAAARLLVGFRFDPHRASLSERWQHALAERRAGCDLPGTTLCYVWTAGAEPVGTLLPSPYTDRVRVVVLRGPKDKGRWVLEQRDLAADYRRAFGADPPPVVSVALLVDTDQTGSSARAWFSPIELEPPLSAPRPDR